MAQPDADDMPVDPDEEQRGAVERQGNVVFWITLATAVLILVICGVYALVL